MPAGEETPRPHPRPYTQGNPAPEKQLAGHVDDASYWHDDSLHSSSHENSAWALRLLLRTLSGSGVMVNRRKLHRQAIRVREVNAVRPARPVWIEALPL